MKASPVGKLAMSREYPKVLQHCSLKHRKFTIVNSCWVSPENLIRGGAIHPVTRAPCGEREYCPPESVPVAPLLPSHARRSLPSHQCQHLLSCACGFLHSCSRGCPHSCSHGCLLTTSDTNRLTPMRRFVAPIFWGSEVHFAVSYSLLLIWESQLTSAHFCTDWDHYRGRVAPSGLPPEKLSACNQANIFSRSCYCTRASTKYGNFGKSSRFQL
ncbi:hypothetical protein EDB19DRAFT_150423 [Suillus lakei]|nr:hypothetical protein EDB19DRAFT_150423 [Suillus lakei]